MFVLILYIYACKYDCILEYSLMMKIILFTYINILLSDILDERISPHTEKQLYN